MIKGIQKKSVSKNVGFWFKVSLEYNVLIQLIKYFCLLNK